MPTISRSKKSKKFCSFLNIILISFSGFAYYQSSIASQQEFILDVQNMLDLPDIDHPSAMQSTTTNSIDTRTTDHSNNKPPFRVIQIGSARTGSTYQYQLLCSILHMKNLPGAPPADCSFIRNPAVIRGRSKLILERAINSGHSFVYKMHKCDAYLQKLAKEQAIAIFSSGGEGDHFAVYKQQREQLELCPTCEIKEYQNFFGLSEIDVQKLETHMSLFSIIRKCCGYQMSKYEILRLNGCDVTQYKKQPDYPHCEQHDLPKVEEEFAKSPIPFIVNDPEYNWGKPGDCKRMNGDIATAKKGFNKRPVKGCRLQKFIGRAPQDWITKKKEKD